MSCLKTSENNHTVPIMYEVIPPKADAKEEKIHAQVEKLLRGLEGKAISAINIPEILDGPAGGSPAINSPQKPEPRKYAAFIQALTTTPYEMVINHVVVHQPLEVQKTWLQESHDLYTIRNFIFVGGAAQDQKYPGPSVNDFSKLVSQTHTVGGILIPHRKEKDTGLHESDRVILKQKNCVSFFTSQVLCETEETKAFLKSYATKRNQLGLPPARFFLSFSPIASENDLEFLRRLGVLIPQEVSTLLLRNPNQMRLRSIEMAISFFKDIYTFIQDNDLKIPLGVNIEYIMRHNIEASYDMVSCF